MVQPDQKYAHHNSSAVVACAKLWPDLTIFRQYDLKI